MAIVGVTEIDFVLCKMLEAKSRTILKPVSK